MTQTHCDGFKHINLPENKEKTIINTISKNYYAANTIVNKYVPIMLNITVYTDYFYSTRSVPTSNSNKKNSKRSNIRIVIKRFKIFMIIIKLS